MRGNRSKTWYAASALFLLTPATHAQSARPSAMTRPGLVTILCSAAIHPSPSLELSLFR
jgi:hypothetical protein